MFLVSLLSPYCISIYWLLGKIMQVHRLPQLHSRWAGHPGTCRDLGNSRVACCSGSGSESSRAARRRVRRRATCRRRTRGDASAGNGGSRHVILELSECLRTRALLKFGRASHSAQRFLPDRHVLLCPHSAPPSPRRQLCCVYPLPAAEAHELRLLQGIPRSMISRSMNTKVNGAYFPPRVFVLALTMRYRPGHWY